MIKKTMAIMLAMAGMMCGCSPKTSPAASSSAPQAAVGPKAAAYVLRAQIYKTSLPVANQVPFQMSDSGEVLSYPDPSDVEGHQPIELTDGWLLDRRGVGSNSAFTSYTYADYSALKSAPSAQELVKAVVPGKVVRIVRLPMTPSEAAADTAAVNALIRSGLKGCTAVYP